MEQTFNNGFESSGQTGRNLEEAIRHRDSVLADLAFFAKIGGAYEEDEVLQYIADNISDFDDLAELAEFVKTAQDAGPFSEYGLSFDFVEAGTFSDQPEGYYRYQFCYGGPSSELRIYEDRIEFVYLDWYTGIGWDVSGDEGAKWAADFFKEVGSIDWDALEYEQKHVIEDEEEDDTE